MGLKEKLKPNSEGDVFAAVGVILMLIGVVVVSFTEFWLHLVFPVALGFIFLIAGIRIDEYKKELKDNEQENQQLRKNEENPE